MIICIQCHSGSSRSSGGPWRGAALSMTTFRLSHDELALRTTVSGMLSTCFSTSTTVKTECGRKTSPRVRRPVRRDGAARLGRVAAHDEQVGVAALLRVEADDEEHRLVHDVLGERPLHEGLRVLLRARGQVGARRYSLPSSKKASAAAGMAVARKTVSRRQW